MSQPENAILTTASAEEEENIIVKARIDPAAFRPLYEKYFRRIFLFVLHRMGEKEIAADITQQVFLKALTGIGKFELRGVPFSSWLYRVAINECNECFRKKKRIHFITVEKASLEELHEALTADATQQELENKLPAILQQLSPDDLVMVELRFFEKKSFREIAEINNMTEVNAKIKTYRILKKMKKLFLQ